MRFINLQPDGSLMPAWQCPALVGRSSGHRMNNLPQDSELRPVHPEAPALPNSGVRLPPAALFSLPQFQHAPSPPQQRLPGGSSVQEPEELEGPPLSSLLTQHMPLTCLGLTQKTWPRPFTHWPPGSRVQMLQGRIPSWAHIPALDAFLGQVS